MPIRLLKLILALFFISGCVFSTQSNSGLDTSPSTIWFPSKSDKHNFVILAYKSNSTSVFVEVPQIYGQGHGFEAANSLTTNVYDGIRIQPTEIIFKIGRQKTSDWQGNTIKTEKRAEYHIGTLFKDLSIEEIEEGGKLFIIKITQTLGRKEQHINKAIYKGNVAVEAFWLPFEHPEAIKLMSDVDLRVDEIEIKGEVFRELVKADAEMRKKHKKWGLF